jgi:hypothetical protein
MATLVLTVVGTLVGGPIGGAIGAIAGQAIDQNILFKPKGRQGPRLNDLAVQTSTYGTQVPKLFGTMRVAGTVIWATDLREQRNRSGGGKGRPSTTTYSYSASFAVLLSGRPIRAIKRIWADGNLLRGTAGDFKTETGFRFYPGEEAQDADPLIAAAEGLGMTPAYRGGAYAVFEDFQLADYGNRIPSLTFEVEADAGPVTLGAIVTTVSGGAVAASGGRTVGGFAASGDSVRGVLETIADAVPVSLIDDGVSLTLADDGAEPVAIAGVERGAGAGDTGARDQSDMQSALTVPVEIALAYYEPGRDYQTGLQRARRAGAGRRGERIEFPAVLAAGDAKTIAEQRLATLFTERSRRTVRTAWRRMALRPGDRLVLDGEAGVWRIAGWRLDRMVVEMALVRWRAGSMAAGSADPGRSTGSSDLVHGPTVVHLLDLPGLADEPAAAPRLLIAAAGPSAGWRRASLIASTDGEASWQPIGGTAAPAVIGVADTVLSNGDAALIDAAGDVEVVLLNAAMMLEDADDAGLIAGRNLAVLGDELIQFGRAEPLGDARWRLSRLTRGRRGTEWAMTTHALGDRFVLIEPDALAVYDPRLAALGGDVAILATGVGDIAEPAEDEAEAIGESVRPPSPVRLSAVLRPDGGYDIGWTRRSRAGWRWLDLVEVPLGEETEAYRLTVTPETGPARVIELSGASYHYIAADVAADAAAGATVGLAVQQRGSLALSRAATLTLAID